MTFHLAGQGMRRFVALGFSVVALPGTAGAFTLLDFPSPSAVLDERHARWFYGSDWFGTGEGDVPQGAPYTLSFAIDGNFMSGQPDVNAAAARQAVVAALQTWSNAAQGAVVFQEAPWDTVMNGSSHSAGASQPGPATDVYQWEGPGIDEWTADWLSGDPEYGMETLPGWGANIEFFSRPNGWVFWSEGNDYNMHSGTLGFAVVTRDAPNNTRIVSVDIYLNASKSWRTDGGSAGFDLQTVLLHELGHALGLDHPNEAAAEGGASLYPCTHENGAPPIPGAVMTGMYEGVKRALTSDDVGGTVFLTPATVTSEHDLNGDSVVNGLDLGELLSAWGVGNSPSDFTGDGIVNGIDLGVLLQHWGAAACP